MGDDDSQETRRRSQETLRRQLLSLLFGAEIPQALEGQLLRTSDVAAMFQVSERTVSEWAKRGQIPSVRTPGGHRRYPADGILALLREEIGELDPAPSDRPPSRVNVARRRPTPT